MVKRWYWFPVKTALFKAVTLLLLHLFLAREKKQQTTATFSDKQDKVIVIIIPEQQVSSEYLCSHILLRLIIILYTISSPALLLDSVRQLTLPLVRSGILSQDSSLSHPSI